MEGRGGVSRGRSLVYVCEKGRLDGMKKSAEVAGCRSDLGTYSGCYVLRWTEVNCSAASSTTVAGSSGGEEGMPAACLGDRPMSGPGQPHHLGAHGSCSFPFSRFRRPSLPLASPLALRILVLLTTRLFSYASSRPENATLQPSLIQVLAAAAWCREGRARENGQRCMRRRC